MGSLDNKVIVVTGAAGVLCSALVKGMAKEGAKLALIGRTKSKLDELAAQVAATGAFKPLAVSADVNDQAQLVAARDEIVKTLGPVDVLVNGAGGNQPKATAKAERMVAGTPLAESFFGIEVAALKQVFDLNFIGTLLPCIVFGEAMAERGGNILNVSSMSAQRPLTKVLGYGAAKAAVDNMTRWLAVHLAPRGVRVNAIAPGFFVTEQNRFLLYEKDGQTLTARGKKIIDHTPLGRFGEADELVAATLWLAGDGSRFVTGTVVAVDGGFSAYSGV